jgi:hypothetical protein
MDYRGHDIRGSECRGKVGFTVHDSDGMLLRRGFSTEQQAREAIDKMLDPDNRGER